MKLKHLLSGAAAVALLTLPIVQPSSLPVGAAAAQAQETDLTIDVFYDALADEGEWVEHPQYRYVWVPSNVDPDWAPYTHGHWVNTDRYGWTFVSDEPFAWAVYHYGRWGFDQSIGWYWVPGTTWAPAWVSWRRGDDAIGWAPLPPEGEGSATQVEASSAEPPRGYWRFVEAREFLAPDLVTVIIRDQEPFERTQVVGPVVVENNIVVNNVIDVDYVRQATGREVQVTKVEVVKDPMRARQPAGEGAIFAVEGQLAEPSRDAAPRKLVKSQQVKAPTKGQDVEATTGSVSGEEKLPTGEDAGKATGGQRAGEAPEGTPGQDNADQGTTGATSGEQPRTKRKIQQGETQPGEAPAMEEQGEENQGAATDQPKTKRKVQQGANQPGEAPAMEGQGEENQGATTDQPRTKRKVQQGANQPGEAPAMQGQGEENQGTVADQPRTKRKVQQGANQPGEAPAVEDQQTQGATGHNGTSKSAQKRLKKQSQGAGGDNAQSQDNAGQGGVTTDQGQASEEQAQEGAKAKGPRRLKSADDQQPSDEQTGAIPGAKAKGGQGGAEQAPGAAGPGGKGRQKGGGGCSAEQQAAGGC